MLGCGCFVVFFFFFKQKTAYEMRISDWSSDVCSSDLAGMTASVIVSESRMFTPAEVDRLAAIGGGDHAVPEMLLCAALWALIRRQFPNAVQESQHIALWAPVDTGVAMRLELEVIVRPAADLRDLALRVKLGRAHVSTPVTNAHL